jgi:hypothetical protein
MDQYTNAPTSSQQQWFQNNVWRMKVTPGYWDNKLTWYPNAWAYMDAYAISPNSGLDQYVARDVNGNMLWIPWGCSGGRCAQYAGNIADAGFRDWWISMARGILAKGYKGLWLDDVNLEERTSDGNGNTVMPCDPATGVAMTKAAWENYMASYMAEIRQAFPGAEIVHNSIWYSGSMPRGSDPYVQREIRSANWVNLERGIDDTGLTGGDGTWSVNELFRFVDTVHSLGTNVLYWDYNAPTDYNVAAFYLTSSGKDGYAAAAPLWNLPDLLNLDLGNPKGQRYTWNGLWRRDFDRGAALVNPPGAATVNADLGGAYTDASGKDVFSVSLTAKQGAVLQGPLTPVVDPLPPPPPVQQPQQALRTSEHINVCGPATGAYNADTEFVGGHCDQNLGNIDISAVRYACPELLYQSKRTTNPGDKGFSYVITAMKPGNYHIRLDFDETVYSAGGRIFNVTINGKPFLNNFDVAGRAGGKYRGVEVDYFWAQPDANGNITIALTNVRNNALLNGITIITW